MSPPRLSIAMLALALLAAAPAAAQEGLAPSGNSGVDQYRETLPAPGGGRPTDRAGSRSPEKTLGKRNAQKLKQFGEDGEEAAEVAAATAPTGATTVIEIPARPGRGGSSGPGEAVAPTGEPAGPGIDNEPSTSALTEVAGQAIGADASGGIGWLLPLVVALAAVGAVAYALGRRGARR